MLERVSFNAKMDCLKELCDVLKSVWERCMVLENIEMNTFGMS